MQADSLFSKQTYERRLRLELLFTTQVVINTTLQSI